MMYVAVTWFNHLTDAKKLADFPNPARNFEKNLDEYDKLCTPYPIILTRTFDLDKSLQQLSLCSPLYPNIGPLCSLVDTAKCFPEKIKEDSIYNRNF